jgi:hypothetical protein
MKAKKLAKVLVMVLVFLPLFVFVMGQIVLHLWNWLAPALFGLHPVTFWQAVGLLVLCRILFGGFGRGSHGRHSHWRHRMHERFDRMRPEDKEELFRRWVGGFDTPPAQADAKS